MHAIRYTIHLSLLAGALTFTGSAAQAGTTIRTGYHWRVPVGARPVIAHNVIGLLRTPVRLCNGAKMVANVILRGRGCSK